MSPIASWYGDWLYVAGGGGLGGDAWEPYTDTLLLGIANWPAGTWTQLADAMPMPVVAAAHECVADRLYGVGGLMTAANATNQNQYLDDGLGCHFGYDIPWLTLTPTAGILAAGDAQALAARFDAAAVAQPGEYVARVRVQEDNPYIVPAITTTLTALPPLPPPTVTLSISAEEVTLTWPDLGASVAHYRVYRSPRPYFGIGDADVTFLGAHQAAGATLTLQDGDPLTPPGARFYRVIPISIGGQEYEGMDVGVFSFSVEPGE
jgi:hypothetical protein